MAGGARVIDAGGRLVVPGFIDAHVHFIEGGFRLASVQLRDAATRDEFVRRIGAFAATVPRGTWITGGDWDHERWGGELPDRDWIDSVTPDHPVWVNRLDGHMALANSAALRAARIDERTASVDGGDIVRGQAQRPTGVLKDNAMTLVDRVVPPPSEAMLDRALDAAMSYVAAQGVTSVAPHGRVGRPRCADAGAPRRPTADARLRGGAAPGLGAPARSGRGRRARRRLAAHRPAQGLRRRVARIEDRAVRRPLRRQRRRPRPGGDHAGATAHVDHRRGPRLAARRRPRHRRPRQPRVARHLRSRCRAPTARAIAASASSTRSTWRPPTSRASRPWASSPACSPTTRSTMGDGRNASSAAHASRRRTPSARCSTRAHGSRSGRTGSSRRRHRSRASTRQSRGGRWTTRNPDGWVPAAEGHGRGGVARLHGRRGVGRLRRGRQGRARSRTPRRPRRPRPRHPRGGAPHHSRGARPTTIVGGRVVFEAP